MSEKITVKATVFDRYGKNRDLSHRLEMSHAVGPIGDIAIKFAMEWGKLAFAEDGEDSTGRQKTRRLNVKEVVQDSIEAAELIFAELFARGHMVELPPLETEKPAA